MREILFRGKWKNSGEWVYGNLFNPDKADTPTQICIGTYIARTCYEIDPETVGQFTGLTDKNGRKIFEGDILIYFGEKNLVEWDDSEATFFLSNESNEQCYFDDVDVNLMLIIGNIYDNPELLKGGVENG